MAEDTNADGVLDENDEYVLINGTHLTTDKNTHAYTSFAENILNADGENEGMVSVSIENNIFGSPILQKDSYGNETRVEYDALNRPVRYIAPNGAERTIEYDNVNNTAILTDENGIKIKYIYNALGDILQKQKYHNGEYKTFEEYTYDEYQKVLTAKVNVTDDDGTVSYYAYDDSGRISKVEIKDFSDNLIRTENYSYKTENSMYKTSKTVTGANGEVLATSTKGIDKYGNVVLESQTSGDTTSLFTYAYDYLNRKISETDANGNTTSYTYDALGNVTKVTDAAGNQTSYDYDLGSRLTAQTDAMGNTSEFFYDGLSRKIKEVLPFDGDIKSVNKTYYDKNSNVVKQAIQSNAPGEAEHFKVTEFKYDAMGNVLASIGRDSGGDSVVQYEYNKANQPTKMITGLSAYSENQTGGNVTTYQYQDGFLMSITDPLGQSESYTYDWLGNMLTKTDRNETVHTYDYGFYGLEETTAGNLKTTTDYDDFGRVINQSQYDNDILSDNVSYMYDAFGRLSKETRGEIEKSYTYDANDNLLSYTLSEAGILKTENEYTYNALNQLTNQIIDDTILTYQYNPLGNIISKQVGNIQTAYTYNAGQHLTGLTNQNGETLYSGYTYAYQLDGNRTNETDTSGIQKSYSYDDLGRLTTEAIIGNDIVQNSAYTYDNRGNRLTKISNGAVTEYTYDANNRLMTEISDSESISYSYDANGNTTLKSIGFITDTGESSISMTAEPLSDISIYTYDALNRLKGITGYKKAVSYTYGVDNLRKSKTVNDITTGYVWNGQNMVAETDGNTIQKIHNYSLDGITKTTQNGEDRFYLKTGHGDVRWTIYENGELNHGYYYDAFGNNLWNYQTNHLETTIEENPFRYAGEYLDEESEMIYLRNRYYDTSTGRFITEDPIKDGLNWYVYCGGNPIAFIDPIGLEYIVVSGSEESGRYKYNFIEPAIKKIKDLKKNAGDEWITWIVSETAYSKKALQQMNDIAYNLGVGFVKINSAAQLQNYVNSQSVTQWELSESRKADPITKMVFFSHGLKGSVELGYGQKNQKSLSIDKNIVDGMFSEAFNSPNTWFYSCNAATGGENSIAKNWHDVAGGYTGGYIGKTTYEYIMYPKNYKGGINKIFDKKMRNIDSSIKKRRSEYGFAQNGSDYYPIPSDGSRLVTYGGI